MELYYLIYTSTPAKLMSNTALQQLLDTSRAANSRFQVTGILISLPDSYIQLIEGPKAHIVQLYRNIQHDPLHFRVTTLREGEITRRFFPDWTMAFEKREAIPADQAGVGLDDDKVLQLFNILES